MAHVVYLSKKNKLKKKTEKIRRDGACCVYLDDDEEAEALNRWRPSTQEDEAHAHHLFDSQPAMR